MLPRRVAADCWRRSSPRHCRRKPRACSRDTIAIAIVDAIGGHMALECPLVRSRDQSLASRNAKAKAGSGTCCPTPEPELR
ncbi:hypothetical protein PF008_g7568 [Phytophthora fragariae]|uniref:Uncharacterized protein n=1 Tax=Phytophthora fragariae TaxID=53985 RepID=A0A6G0S2C0_9STRA|nr:hypothetical protein PF003_g2662 [Phytophthora fragariae]KAE9347985.1 hypothetical protein PF008_g7568 [Phytophthora fragariae]